MNRTERIKFIATKLDEYFPNPPIPLIHEDAYTLLIAVLLSAQCTDVRVNQITPFLFKKAKTPEAMIKLKVETIMEIVKPCGFLERKAQTYSIYQKS